MDYGALIENILLLYILRLVMFYDVFLLVLCADLFVCLVELCIYENIPSFPVQSATHTEARLFGVPALGIKSASLMV